MCGAKKLYEKNIGRFYAILRSTRTLSSYLLVLQGKSLKKKNSKQFHYFTFKFNPKVVSLILEVHQNLLIRICY